MGTVIIDVPNPKLKKALEEKLAQELSDKNFLDFALYKSEMPIQWGYKALMELKARTKGHPYWEDRIGKYSIRIAEARSDAPN